jgi:hypothetical protein
LTALGWVSDLLVAGSLATASCERESDKWLAAVDHHSRSTPGGTARA